ncbi:head-to-tail joining protein [Rhodobacter phage RcCronus]|uniref:Head-to-tail joining protein n=2 Tax=Cronusvirus cronus TaxID=2005060 RepID=A0A0K1Y6F9_9CAUD|nr:head closure Hc1 [Rhodobacter phage RcCronus]AKU43298.1 head-to-tail joining protein [Rhodobacter phage RcCronus]AKY02676.1 head-to-tail joining protein [Rhodobacter phage RcSaxon]
MIGGDDWDVFFDPDDFADSAVWDTQAGEFVEIDGIFEAGREVVLAGDGAGISAIMPVLTVASDSVPATAAQGDDLEVRDKNFRVADLQPDGSGLTRVILERV